ncbi:glycosyltransferase, partial [Citrobacter braakii]
YFQQISACSIFAMPIEQNLTRSTADQTILNAMHQGKIVVATDSIGPRIYLRDAINGFLVREPTVEAWKSALARALNLTPEERAAMADQAAFDA